MNDCNSSLLVIDNTSDMLENIDNILNGGNGLHSGLTIKRLRSRILTSNEENATADVTPKLVADSTVVSVFVISLRVLRITKPDDFRRTCRPTGQQSLTMQPYGIIKAMYRIAVEYCACTCTLAIAKRPVFKT